MVTTARVEAIEAEIERLKEGLRALGVEVGEVGGYLPSAGAVPFRGWIDELTAGGPTNLHRHFVPADKDADGEFEPLTAAAWENSTKSGAGPINWNSVFGVPANAKVVAVIAHSQHSVLGAVFDLKAKSTTTNPSFRVRCVVANSMQADPGLCPIASGGTSYYGFSTAFDAFYLRVVGWFV